MEKMLFLLILSVFSFTRSAHATTPLDGIEESTPTLLQSKIGNLLDQSRLLAIAEPIHGSKDIVQTFGEIAQFAIEQKGVRHLAFEYRYYETLKLNDYIHGKGGDVHTLLGGVWWDVNDLATFFDWLKAYNQAHPLDSVEIHGADIYDNPLSTQDALLKFNANIQSLQGNLQHELSIAGTYCPGANLPTLKEYYDYMMQVSDGKIVIDPSSYQTCESALIQILSKIKANKNAIQKEIGTTTYATLENVARNYLANARYFLVFIQNHDYHLGWEVRDTAMAENILAILESVGNAKMIFLAHTSHTAKMKSEADWWGIGSGRIVSAGKRIFKSLGEDYKVVGITGYQLDGIQGNFLKPTSEWSLDFQLHQSGYQKAWVNVNQGFVKTRSSWWVHNENDAVESFPEGVFLNPSDNYDAMIYLDRSEASVRHRL